VYTLFSDNPYNMQMYPKLLNYPSVVRVGFLLYSHKYHHSEKFQDALEKYILHPVASKWRRAAATINLHLADTVSVAGKAAIIPSAICIECREHDLALVRSELQHIYPLRPRQYRFSYPRQVKSSFCNTFNRFELDQVDEQSQDIAKSLWHIQLLTNQRERYASIAHLLRKPKYYECHVMLEGKPFPSVRRLLLEMLVPYKDSRGKHASLFTSCDDVIPYDSTILDVGMTFRPQNTKYAQNAVENLALHFHHRCCCPKEYLQKVFKTSHLLMMRSKQWHDEHQKAYDPKHMQEGLSASELSHTMAEFNLDISVVLQDAVMAISRTAAVQDGKGVSVPQAASNASQQISILNSITTFRAADEEMEETLAIDQIPQASAQPAQNTPQAWALRHVVAATNNSIVLPTTAVTTLTSQSNASTTQTTPAQEDSSLTMSTEHVGMSEAQIQRLLADHDKKWQAKMKLEIDRLAKQTTTPNTQPKPRRTRRPRNRVQTAHQHGGGPAT
jgi:hypothetical protein